jgi:hypothetical protein
MRVVNVILTISNCRKPAELKKYPAFFSVTSSKVPMAYKLVANFAQAIYKQQSDFVFNQFKIK